MISLVINTLNEEQHVGDCILSAQGLADEVVVCDMHSDDRTVEIARGLGARVVLHERTGFVEPARRFAIGQATHEWVLVLDADERMTPRLAEKLREAADQDRYDVVTFWCLYWYFGAWVRHGGFYSGDRPRFFRKATYEATYDPSEAEVHGNFRALRRQPNKLMLGPEYYFEHLAYPTIEKYVTKTLGMYARVEAEKIHEQGHRFRSRFLVTSPLTVFVQGFLGHQGYRDGIRGFVLAVLNASFRFCVWANVWLLEQGARK